MGPTGDTYRVLQLHVSRRCNLSCRHCYSTSGPEFRDQVRMRIRELRTKSPKLLEQLPMPVLFVTGDEDWVFPPAAGPALARIAPKGSAVRVPAAGHSVYFERAAKFNEIIGRIL